MTGRGGCLFDRDVLRDAIYGGGRRKDDVFDAFLDDRFEECTRLERVFPKVELRLFDRFGHKAFGGEMDDSIDIMMFDDGFDKCRITDVAFVKADPADGFPVSGR